MKNWEDIPENINKKKCSNSYLPFNINDYINQKYENKKKQLENYEKELKDKKLKYDDFLNFLIETFKKDLFDNKNKCIIELELYGPDTELDSSEKELRDGALENFYYILRNKGYIYNIDKREERIRDFGEGWCNKCTQYITIYLN